MALSLHTTPTYKVEYGQTAIHGWNEIEEFIDFLYEKRREVYCKNEEEAINSAWNDVYINEDETEIEIPFSVLEEIKYDPVWGTTAELIIDNSDKDNAEAHLSIW